MTHDMEYELIAEVLGRGEADVIQGLLEAEGIPVQLIEESVSQSSYAVPFAPVKIYVPKEQAEQAREIIEPYNAEVGTDEDEEEEGEDEEQ